MLRSPKRDDSKDGKKVAAKLYEVIKYVESKVTNNKNVAAIVPLALGHYYRLVEIHNENMKVIFFPAYTLCMSLYASGLKGLPGASSNRIAMVSVCLAVHRSVIPSHLQKCNILSLGYDTFTKLVL